MARVPVVVVSGQRVPARPRGGGLLTPRAGEVVFFPPCHVSPAHTWRGAGDPARGQTRASADEHVGAARTAAPRELVAVVLAGEKIPGDSCDVLLTLD